MDRPHIVVMDDSESSPVAILFQDEETAKTFVEFVGEAHAKIIPVVSRVEVVASALETLNPCAGLGVVLASYGAL